jgi:hypothetical protein
MDADGRNSVTLLNEKHAGRPRSLGLIDWLIAAQKPKDASAHLLRCGIYPDPERLRRYGITLQQLQNTIVAAQDSRRIQDIRQLVITRVNNVPVLVNDVVGDIRRLNDLSPPKKPKEINAREVMSAYSDNDAAGDEQFLGKRLRVSGRVWRVRRVAKEIPLDLIEGDVDLDLVADLGVDGKPVLLTRGAAPACYLLTLYAVSDTPGVDFPRPPQQQPLAFQFPAQAGKELAQLKRDQDLWIEGRCQGRIVAAGKLITFTDCRIIKKARTEPGKKEQRDRYP